MTYVKYALVLAVVSASAVNLAADPVLAITPSTGALAGVPGSIVGWGFDLTSDPVDAITITSSFLIDETYPGAGSYTDIISYFGGPSSGYLQPDANTWKEAFSFNSDPGLATGLGYFQIAPDAAIGSSDTGTLVVEYELDLPSCGYCYVSSGTFELPFSVSVSPEPDSLGLLLIGLGIGLNRWRRYS